MRYPALYFMVFLLSLVLANPLFASDSGVAYRKAYDAYVSLQKSTKRQQFRSEWQKVLRQFVQVYELDPAGSHAPEALFMAGKTLSGQYRISRIDTDAWEAVTMYDHMAQDIPTSSLADDALLLSGELLENSLDAPEEACVRYQRLIELFPKGDMVAKARQRLKVLARYVPKPSVVNKPVTVKAATPLAVVPVPLPDLAVATGQHASLSGIRFWSNPGYTRVVIDLTGNASYTSNFLAADPVEHFPPRLYLDIGPASLDSSLSASTDVDDGLLRKIRTGITSDGKVRVVFDLVSVSQYKIFPLNDPYRLVIDISGDQAPELTAREPSLQASPPGTSDAVTNLLAQRPAQEPPPVLPTMPVLSGLRRIVVDPGHGGKDPGAIGPSGLREKDVTLSMAKVLAANLQETLGCEVVLTRDHDVYLPLEERTAIANKVGADLFISVHANAAPNRQAYGIETYYLNFSKNDKAAAVAARENGTSIKEVGDLELILFDLMANAKINESSRLAAEIQRSLVGRLTGQFDDIRDLGVRQGPFYVLLGATMPSVLVETAFISHPREERRLANSSYHEQTAEAITEAVKNYARAHKMIATR